MEHQAVDTSEIPVEIQRKVRGSWFRSMCLYYLINTIQHNICLLNTPLCFGCLRVILRGLLLTNIFSIVSQHFSKIDCSPWNCMLQLINQNIIQCYTENISCRSITNVSILMPRLLTLPPVAVPSCLRHEQSSIAPRPWLLVRIPPWAWMFNVCPRFSLFVLSCG
jgi:hypothetical protein